MSEIHDFAKENISDMPSIVLNNETKYFTYVANVQGHLILLIDVEYLLSDDEVESVKKLKEDLM